MKNLRSIVSNFKIEGRGLGSALILEFLLYYMTKPEYHLHVREAIYLDNMLDLFWIVTWPVIKIGKVVFDLQYE